MADGVEGSLQIGVYHRIKILFLHPHQQVISCNSCIVHQNINMLIFFDEGINHSLTCLKIRYIALICHSSSACFPDLTHSLLCRSL